MKIESELQ